MSPPHPDRGRPQEPTNRLLRDDSRFALGRIAAFQYATVAVFLFLIVGFWLLQVRDHEVNSELAERNRVKTVPLVAPRGKILDRDGRVIVDNRPSFRVLLSRENLNKDHFAAIAQGLHLELAELQSRVKRYDSRPKYISVPIKTELTRGELAFVESHLDAQTFPELEVSEDSSARLYPQNGLAAHVLGYVGEVSDAQLNMPEFAKYSQGEIVGKSGLEQQYNDILMGVDGQRASVVDNVGRERQVLENKEATPGHNLQTTLDMDLQAVAELSMDGRKGAVIALDPRNGEVLAMVSRPTFDPGMFEGHIRQQEWNDVVNNPDTPLLNNAIQAQFAPGSTFKPIVALAGLETGLLEPSTTFYCPGYATFYGVTHKCDAVHGTINLHQAIVHSCDVYFYNVGNRLGIDTIAEYAQMAGFGKKTGIDLPNEAEGRDALHQMEAADAARKMVRGRNYFRRDRTRRGGGDADPARRGDRGVGHGRSMVPAPSGARRRRIGSTPPRQSSCREHRHHRLRHEWRGERRWHRGIGRASPESRYAARPAAPSAFRINSPKPTRGSRKR